jgi:Mg2+/Co2+ transporter CorC
MGIVLGPNGRERGFVTIERLLQTLVGEVAG